MYSGLWGPQQPARWCDFSFLLTYTSNNKHLVISLLCDVIYSLCVYIEMLCYGSWLCRNLTILLEFFSFFFAFWILTVGWTSERHPTCIEYSLSISKCLQETIGAPLGTWDYLEPPADSGKLGYSKQNKLVLQPSFQVSPGEPAPELSAIRDFYVVSGGTAHPAIPCRSSPQILPNTGTTQVRWKA